MEPLEKITNFISKHHVLSLATYGEDGVSVCSVFYAYEEQTQQFVFASDTKTTHIQHILKNPQVGANILLETAEVGKIEGLQIKGKCKKLQESSLKKLYFKTFPYALALAPTLWCLDVEYFKLTDNRLGFGKKLIWP